MNNNDNVSQFDIHAFRGHFRIAASHFENGVAQFENLQKLSNSLKQTIAKLEVENCQLRQAFNDAINSPLGVVPDSAIEFYSYGEKVLD